jgi:hypothetical protein
MTQMAKPQLHQSSLSMLARCGEQFRRRYIEGERIPPGIALLTGTAVHEAARANLMSKVERGKLLPIEEVKAAAADKLAQEWEKGVFLSADESAIGEGNLKHAATDVTVALAAFHATELAPTLKPLVDKAGVEHGVEWPFVLECNGFPYDLAGQVDVIESTRGKGGGLHIRDLKTAGQSPAKTLGQTSMQGTLYSFAVKVHKGKAPKSFKLDHLVKNKVPKLVTVEGTRTDADFEVFMRRFERSVEVIEAGQFVPADPSHPLCSPKYCGYYSTCKFARGHSQFNLGGDANGKKVSK